MKEFDVAEDIKNPGLLYCKKQTVQTLESLGAAPRHTDWLALGYSAQNRDVVSLSPPLVLFIGST
jgi:hypothetical protein